ncbi:MAG: hypothetical protein WD397_00755 [Wenzhouxiangellaceae bacterium]
MNHDSNHIRLVAGFEIRPPAGASRFVLERAESERLAGLIADDLAHCVAEVTRGHLVTGPTLLEPGQILSPEHAPWDAMLRVAGPGPDPEPSITSIGAHQGRLAHASLMPYWTPPQGLFVCLPIVLAGEATELGPLSARLEQVLFETGALRPPAMGTLAEISGLDPVHGQLMTCADLMALTKVQLAGAGLDPFWPPVEHALLARQEPARLELPGGLMADWNVSAGGWELEFQPFHAGPGDSDGYALWLRALRQTIALLESHLVRWRALGPHPGVEIDEHNRWARCDLGPADAINHGWRVEHPDIGLVAYATVIAGRQTVFYPLDQDALADLKAVMHESGVGKFEPTGHFELLESR